MTNFACCNMNRTFHYRASLLNYAAVVLAAAAALCVFWYKSAAKAIVGMVLMIAVVLMVERIIHTAYVFTDDGLLVICKGRFSRHLTIRISDILSAEVIRRGLLPVRYVLIRYGAGHEVAVQPVNETAFINEIKRRQTPGGKPKDERGKSENQEIYD